MSLLTIVQDAADEVGIARPATVAGNSAPDAQKLLRLLNKCGKALVKQAVWQDLRKEKTFTGVAGSEQTSIIPSDFDRFIPETFWDRTNVRLVTGPITPVQWQAMKAQGYGGSPKFIYRGGSVFILPNLDGGESIAFEYVSQNWCQSSGGTGQTAFAADDDTGILDEELLKRGLIFAYLDTEGLPSALAARDFEMYSKQLLNNDQPNTPILVAADIFGGGRHFTGVPSSGAGYNINYD